MEKLVIDLDVLAKKNIPKNLFFYLLSLSFNGEINSNTPIRAWHEGYTMKEAITSPRGYTITPQGRDLLRDVLLDSKEQPSKDLDLTSLAEKLKEIYPAGRKTGTSYQWRGSTIEIVRKLKTLMIKYKCKFTEEQAIEATRRYVQSFNGNYTYMKLLKYFLLKTEPDKDGNVEVKSDFMSLLENEDNEDFNNEWTAELK